MSENKPGKKKETRVDKALRVTSEAVTPKVRWMMSRWPGKVLGGAVMAASVAGGIKFGLDNSAPESAPDAYNAALEYGKLILPIGAAALGGFCVAYLVSDVPKEGKAIDMGNSGADKTSTPPEPQITEQQPATPTPEA